MIVIFSTGNGIPNTLQTCGDAFVLSSWRHEGGKPVINTLDSRYTLVEYGVETSHTSWEQVECSFGTSVRVHARYEIAKRTLPIRIDTMISRFLGVQHV